MTAAAVYYPSPVFPRECSACQKVPLPGRKNVSRALARAAESIAAAALPKKSRSDKCAFLSRCRTTSSLRPRQKVCLKFVQSRGEASRADGIWLRRRPGSMLIVLALPLESIGTPEEDNEPRERRNHIEFVQWFKWDHQRRFYGHIMLLLLPNSTCFYFIIFCDEQLVFIVR